MNNPKENTVTYEDFEDQKVVLLADEAHHINAETKKDSIYKYKNQIILLFFPYHIFTFNYQQMTNFAKQAILSLMPFWYGRKVRTP